MVLGDWKSYPHGAALRPPCAVQCGLSGSRAGYIGSTRHEGTPDELKQKLPENHGGTLDPRHYERRLSRTSI
jgi:hypothetical protein